MPVEPQIQDTVFEWFHTRFLHRLRAYTHGTMFTPRVRFLFAQDGEIFLEVVPACVTVAVSLHRAAEVYPDVPYTLRFQAGMLPNGATIHSFSVPFPGRDMVAMLRDITEHATNMVDTAVGVPDVG